MISLWYDVGGRLTLQPKRVVEDVGHFQLFGLGVQSLGAYPHLNVVALCVSLIYLVSLSINYKSVYFALVTIEIETSPALLNLSLERFWCMPKSASLRSSRAWPRDKSLV